MTESIALAIAVPAALGAAWLASRRSWSPAAADNRGIALQTVIIIVVLLVIAGGVAGVLLSRGSDVIGDLEAQDIGIGVTAANCEAQVLNGIVGNGQGGPPFTSCTFTGAEVSDSACRNLRNSDGDRGAVSGSGSSKKCTVTF